MLGHRTGVDDEDDVADLKVVKISTPRHHGATTLVRQHRRNDIVSHM
jgi:hypothetical protein